MCVVRGSFRKIVKRGQKLTVEKFGGASLVLFPHFMQCLQVPGGANAPLCPQKIYMCVEMSAHMSRLAHKCPRCLDSPSPQYLGSCWTLVAKQD